MHNNMITVDGKKMGERYGNHITCTQLFSGDSPVLPKAYHPMVIRFFILQTHYRSTLDFSNEALQAAERGLKRLWEAYEHLQKLVRTGDSDAAGDAPLDGRVSGLIKEFEEFMNDDFSTAKILANMFELVPTINSMKDQTIATSALSAATFELLQNQMHVYLEDILGIQSVSEQDNGKLQAVMQLVMDIRREARGRKDFATSDKIRNQLQEIGILLKDEKNGEMSFTIS